LGEEFNRSRIANQIQQAQLYSQPFTREKSGRKVKVMTKDIIQYIAEHLNTAPPKKADSRADFECAKGVKDFAK
jgi:hypothetical protein